MNFFNIQFLTLFALVSLPTLCCTPPKEESFIPALVIEQAFLAGDNNNHPSCYYSRNGWYAAYPGAEPVIQHDIAYLKSLSAARSLANRK